MPDPVTHYVFGEQVFHQLPKNIQAAVEKPVFQRALQGPDPWSCLGFYGGKIKQYARRGVEMHRSKTGLFLTALTKQTKQTNALFPVLAGNICHYCLDRLAHPYIICKAGFFDGSEESRIYRSGHTRLERAIDSYYIRTVYGKTPWHFSLPRHIMSCKQYPETLRHGLNAVYREVYGWDSTFDLINQSLRDERRFYGLMQDPFGIVHMLLRIVSGGKTNYSLYSFFRREIQRERLDYLNENRTPWQHPYDPSSISKDSFFDLFNRAKDDALGMIQAAYQWVFQDKESLPVFNNSNYSTGLDCNDPRNTREPLCQPLAYSNKYWN